MAPKISSLLSALNSHTNLQRFASLKAQILYPPSSHQLLKCSQFLLCLTAVFFPFSLAAGGLFPPGSRCVGAGRPHRIQGNCSSQPPAIHRCLHHPGHGRHALPPGLPGLLWSHPRKQVSAPLCESADKFKV